MKKPRSLSRNSTVSCSNISSCSTCSSSVKEERENSSFATPTYKETPCVSRVPIPSFGKVGKTSEFEHFDESKPPEFNKSSDFYDFQANMPQSELPPAILYLLSMCESMK
eukprot:Platyproteum_vivax@DN461_c0_g1_i1.p1